MPTKEEENIIALSASELDKVKHHNWSSWPTERSYMATPVNAYSGGELEENIKCHAPYRLTSHQEDS
jgi:hypothetical protein